RPRLVPRRVVRRGAAGRRALAPFAVTWRRLRARPGRAALVAVGVAVSIAFLLGVGAGGGLSGDLAPRPAPGSLPPRRRGGRGPERVGRVSWSGQVAPGGYARLDRRARAAIEAVSSEPVAASIDLADVRLGHGLVKLGAANSLQGVVALRSGRLPRGCSAARC